MENVYIILVEDQREVLEAVYKDLTSFQPEIRVEECESAEEAWEVLTEIYSRGDYPALVISDHVMPGKSGVDFLVEVSRDARFTDCRKVLLTGLATHQDTIRAINQAGIHQYIEKPWKPEFLKAVVSTQLTRYLLHKGIDYKPFAKHLDSGELLAALRSSGE